MFPRRILPFALVAALVAVTALPAIAGGRHYGGHGHGFNLNPGLPQAPQVRHGGGFHHRGGNWSDHRGHRHGWGHRHRTPNWVAPLIGGLILGGAVTAAPYYYAPPRACYPHGCYVFEYGRWVWYPNY